MSIFTARKFSAAFLFAVLLTISLGITASAQISITSTGASYSENFDGMGPSGTSYIAGWTGVNAAAATLTPVVFTTSSTAGAVYNTGTASAADRALGMLASGTTVPRIGAQYVNNTGVTITAINFAGVMEQWKTGTSTAVNEVDAFEYSLDATSLTTGTWTRVSAIDLNEKLTTTTTAVAVDGNSSTNRTSLIGSVSGLSWTNGGTMWIRWSDANDTGTDALLAIDDFSMAFNVAPIQFGKGTASVLPAFVRGTSAESVKVTVRGQASYTLTNANVVLPSIWSWSHTTGDISLTGGGSPSVAISGDTVQVSGMTVGGSDSIQITILNITAGDTTSLFTIPVQTGIAPDSIFNLANNPFTVVYGTPKAIADIKTNDANGLPLLVNKYITTHGVVTVANQFGGPGYIEDNGAGIAIFDSSFSNHVTIGDEVAVVGIVSPFNGLCELGSTLLISTISTGNNVVPLVVTPTQIRNDGAGGVENYEGLLVRLNGVQLRTFANGSVSNWTVSGSGTNYLLNAGGADSCEVRVDNSVNFANAPAPQSAFDVIGVVSQFKNASPYIGGYQFMPRMSSDIIAGGPVIATSPVESNLAPTSMTISWTTLNNGNTRLRYGTTTAYELGVLAPDNVLGLSHSVNLSGLTAATVYHVMAFSVDSAIAAGDTSAASDLVVSTSSPLSTTGQMNVYFNRTVDNSVSLGENALGNQDLVSKVTARINNARYTIDLALYSMSGSGYGDAVATALVAAKNRGVRVRVISEHDNTGGSGFTILRNGGIPVIDDTFDPVNAGAGLSHNKFFVFDYVGGAPDSVWVWGGSWNVTNPGTTGDRQNSIEIQDVALAGAYTMEFELMWGSNTITPNATNSRFGSRKTDIIPHNFNVNGTPVGLYFSPSDHTTGHITGTMAKAEHSVANCIYTFTRKDIADTLIARKAHGDKVRIVVDNSTDQGNQYSYLQTNSMDVHLKGFGGGLLHHKYAVIDGEQVGGTPYCITGSHNWSNSAENSNDENTLIIQSRRIANLYLQEFTARYYEAGGIDSIHVANTPVFAINKTSINFDSVVVGNSKQDSFIVTNTGTVTLNISSATSSNVRYTVSPGTAAVAPSAAQTFIVTYSPISQVITNAKIILTHDAFGSPDTVLLTGRGSGSATYGSDRSSIDFDTVVVGNSKIDSFTVSNTGNGSLKISSLVSSDAEFSALPDSASIAPSGSQKFIVTFAPTSNGPKSANLVLFHNAAGGHDTVRLQGIGRYSNELASYVAIGGGWNMLSLPVMVADGRKSVVFPGASSRAFTYEGAYVIKDSLVTRKGYWLKFPSAAAETLSGVPAFTDTFTVVPKWNMIGSISDTVLVSSVTASSGIVFQSPFYGYAGSYDTADTIIPGKAYWIKVNQAGSLYLSAAPHSAPKVSPSAAFDGMNRLEITDADGHKQTLYFSEKKEDGAAIERYEMPPVPPAGGFDARFASNNRVEFYPQDLKRAVNIPIALQISKSPVTVRWTVAADKMRNFTLASSGSDRSAPIQLVNEGQTVLSGKAISSLVLAVSPATPLPEKFALNQNYPNPFNPGTSINYELPSPAYVTLKVYNTLGQEIATLVDGMQDAGYKTERLDMSNMPSGVYVYRISARQTDGGQTPVFTDVKKMILMK